MAFTSEMFDQLRDFLTDPTDSQVDFSTKKLYLNRGVARLWPKVFRIVDAGSIPVVAGQYEYTLPTAMNHGHVLTVELESGNATGLFYTLGHYEVIPATDALPARLKIGGTLPAVGSLIRVRYGAPIARIAAASYAASGSETWVGPEEAIGLPVVYAMGLISLRKLDDRLDHSRYSTTQAANGVQETDLMSASQVWFNQFDLELAELGKRFELYLPHLILPPRQG